VASEEPASVQAAELSQRLAETRDENKVLAARVLELQGWLDEKVRALDQARSEVRAVTAEVARTRDEIQRWRREADGLRQRALHAEQENQASLRAMAQLVQMMLDQEAAARPGTPP
jgi:chromosome segregation ATPase